jgi:tRNA (cytidine/uridine-2'-O-)-methyltransferase
MFSIVLYQPEIPPNTGNIIRLAANTGCDLHLVKPLGFALDAGSVRRAGLDYHDLARITIHDSWADCRASLEGRRLFTFSTRATRNFAEIHYRPRDVFLFGPETRGLPTTLLSEIGLDSCLRLPMYPDNRSLNLSNAVAIAVYEAWRQNDFAGAHC